MKIERSNTAGRFTPEQLVAKTRESRAFWTSPEGIARKAVLDRENRSRKPSPARSPELVGRKPALHRNALIEVEIAKAKLGIL